MIFCSKNLENVKFLHYFVFDNNKNMQHLFEIMTIGSMTASLKAMFFFGSIDNKNDKDIEAAVDKMMNQFKNVSNPNIVRNTLRWLENDDFSIHFKKDYDGHFYYNGLLGLKRTYLEFFQCYIDHLHSNDSTLLNVADIISKNEEYILQIARLRMIVDPEIQLSRNVHKETKIVYMKVKGFWLSDTGVKQRKYFKSLGRFDSYPNGILDTSAILEGRRKIREEMHTDYIKHYQ